LDRRWLRRRLSGAANLVNHPRLDWLGRHLRHPRLWHLGRRTVALGSAIGICFGILVPFGQIPLAVAAATLFRANLPTAILGTFVTNGFTYVPIYVLAYWLGCMLTGTGLWSAGAAAVPWWEPGWVVDALSSAPHTWDTLGLPLAVGVVALSALAAVTTYLGVFTSWTLHVRRNRNRRRSRQAT
jgi:uncharacterized protein (DUF2062 family)